MNKNPSLQTSLALLSDPDEVEQMLNDEAGSDILRCYRHQQRRADPPPTPSRRGAPSERDLDTAWRIVPRTLLDALRIGSRLVDLEPTVDNSFVFAEDLQGRRIILRRQPGIKGWLDCHCPDITYSTAMHYKRLAARLRTVCGAPPDIPLEWLLPDSTENLSGLNSTVRATIKTARKTLVALLRDFPTRRKLTAELERRLGFVRFRKKRKEISLKSHFGKARRNGGARRGKFRPISTAKRPRRCAAVSEAAREMARKARADAQEAARLEEIRKRHLQVGEKIARMVHRGLDSPHATWEERALARNVIAYSIHRSPIRAALGRPATPPHGAKHTR